MIRIIVLKCKWYKIFIETLKQILNYYKTARGRVNNISIIITKITNNKVQLIVDLIHYNIKLNV